jgi:hypothetical protein
MIRPAADISAILAACGVPALISEADKDDKTVQVIFDRNSLNEMGVLTDKPQITIAAADLDGVDIPAATITVSGETWRLLRPLNDGAGLIIAGLQRTT